MLGNHRDAWVAGAVDPTSGTAAILETGRALASLRDAGWKPRRTIVWCSWDAEEYGLLVRRGARLGALRTSFAHTTLRTSFARGARPTEERVGRCSRKAVIPAHAPLR